MKVRICYYHDREQLRFLNHEGTGIGDIKAVVKRAGLYVTHVDVYLGDCPCRFKARVRRVDGTFLWSQLERCVAEYHD
jgi:hypothetical protein